MKKNAVSVSEDAEQITVIDWVTVMQRQHPELGLMFHPANGGKRAAREAVKLQHMGVRPGVPDLQLPVRKGVYSGLMIELKRADRGTVSDRQREYLKLAAFYGAYVSVCYGSDEAIRIISEYIDLQPGEDMPAPNLSIFKRGNCKPLCKG